MDHPSLFSRPVPFERMQWLKRGNRIHRALHEETQLLPDVEKPRKKQDPMWILFWFR